MQSIASAAGGQSLQSLGYSYDTAGNLSGMVDAVMGQMRTYTYDALDRLVGAAVTGSAPGLYSESYSYDNLTATGNLQSKGGVGYTYGDPNHKHAVTSLSNGNSYQYDSNGNITSRHVYENGQFRDYTLAYDAENRMVAVSGAGTASYVYNGDGARVIATVNGVTTIHIGNWYEYNLSSWQATKYYDAGSQRIAMQRWGDPLTWLLGDHLGSTSVAYVSGGGAGGGMGNLTHRQPILRALSRNS